MRPPIVALLLGLVCAACADPTAERHAFDPEREDAGTLVRDAGRSDAGTSAAGRDAGMTYTGFRCWAGSAVATLAGEGEEYALGALAASPSTIAVAFTRRSGGAAPVASVLMVDRGTGQTREFGLGELGSPLAPAGLGVADDALFVAGALGAPPSGSSGAVFDPEGAVGAAHRIDGQVAMSAVRTPFGGAMLAVAAAGGPDDARAVRILRVAPEAQAVAESELATTRRLDVQWDIDWAPGDPAGVACGARVEADGERLALFGFDAESMTANVTGLRVPPAPANEAARFGCRIAASDSLHAVAWSATGVGARVAWLSPEGATVAGPAPFVAAYAPATAYDVAVRGERTALAFAEQASGMERVALRIYPGPGEKPIELDGDSGIALGAITTGRIRLVSDGAGFLLAFDASRKAGERTLVVRPITCKP